MALTAADQPTPIECGSADQTFLDNINNFRELIFQCLLAQQNDLDGLEQDLPSIICNEFSSRIYTQVASGNPAIVTVPAGGTWAVHVTSYGNFSNNQLTPNVIGTLNEADQSSGAVYAGTVAGGTQFGGTAGGGSTLSISMIAFRIDCP